MTHGDGKVSAIRRTVGFQLSAKKMLTVGVTEQSCLRVNGFLFSKIFPFVVFFLCQAVLSWRNIFFWHVASLLQTHNGRISSQQPNIHHEQTMPFGISFKQCCGLDHYSLWFTSKSQLRRLECAGFASHWPLHVFNKCVILLLDCDWKVVGSLFCIIYILCFFCWSTSCKTWLFIPFPAKPSNFNLQHPISYAQSFSFVVMFWLWSSNPKWKIHKL